MAPAAASTEISSGLSRGSEDTLCPKVPKPTTTTTALVDESFDVLPGQPITMSPSTSSEEVTVQNELTWEVDEDEETAGVDEATPAQVQPVKQKSNLRVQSRFLLKAGGILFSSISRAARKPRCPSWPMAADVILAFVKEAAMDQTSTVEQNRQRIPIKSSIPIRGTKVERVKVNGIKCEWVVHSCARHSNRYVFYIHGGAYCLHSPAFYRQMTSLISRAACAKVLVIDYGLAPENPYPAGLNDCLDVYKWMIATEGCNISASHISVMGDSAGAGMTVALMLRLKEESLPKPAGIVLFSPWVNLLCDEPSWKENDKYDYLVGPEQGALRMAKYYAGAESLTHPKISPLYADLTGLPPTLIHVGQLEMPRDQGTRFAEKAKASGVDVEIQTYTDMVHVFQTFAPLFPKPVAQSMTSVNEFINRVMTFEPSKLPSKK